MSLTATLGLLVQAVRPRLVASIGAEPEAQTALERAAKAAGARFASLDAGEPIALPPATRLLYVGPKASVPDLTGHAHGLLIVAHPDVAIQDLAGGRDPALQFRVDLPAPTPGAPGALTLILTDGRIPQEVRDTLDALHTASRTTTPTQPIDSAAGALLFVLARAKRPKRAVEIGTGAGASTLWLGAALEGTGGRLVTLEKDSARATLARRNLRAAGLEDRVELKLGEAVRLLPKLAGAVELVFLDETAEDREDDLLAVLPMCAHGALVISYGALVDPAGLARVNALMRTLPQFRLAGSLGVAAGMTLAIVA